MTSACTRLATCEAVEAPDDLGRDGGPGRAGKAEHHRHLADETLKPRQSPVLAGRRGLNDCGAVATQTLPAARRFQPSMAARTRARLGAGNRRRG